MKRTPTTDPGLGPQAPVEITEIDRSVEEQLARDLRAALSGTDTDPTYLEPDVATTVTAEEETTATADTEPGRAPVMTPSSSTAENASSLVEALNHFSGRALQESKFQAASDGRGAARYDAVAVPVRSRLPDEGAPAQAVVVRGSTTPRVPPAQALAARTTTLPLIEIDVAKAPPPPTPAPRPPAISTFRGGRPASMKRGVLLWVALGAVVAIVIVVAGLAALQTDRPVPAPLAPTVTSALAPVSGLPSSPPSSSAVVAPSSDLAPAALAPSSEPTTRIEPSPTRPSLAVTATATATATVPSPHPRPHGSSPADGNPRGASPSAEPSTTATPGGVWRL